MRSRYLLLVACVFFCPLVAGGAEQELCHAGRGASKVEIHGFTIRLVPSKNDDTLIDGCRAVIRDRDGRVVFKAEDFGLVINKATGLDINQDGVPDAVIEGYSGGAHCCWTYWIVSLDEQSTLLRKVCNQRPVQFRDLKGDHRIEIVTSDGAFDYFDDLSHAYSPFPQVVLRLEGRELLRANEEFWESYEQEIAEAREQLSAGQIRRFRNDDREPAEWLESKQRVLTIVLAYLYGGRESEAWKTLDEMWPLNDVKRIRSEIMKTAEGSFLGSTRRPSYGCWE